MLYVFFVHTSFSSFSILANDFETCDASVRRYSIGAVPRLVAPVAPVRFRVVASSRLAQLVERKTLNLVVVGSSPTVGVHFNFCKIISPIFFNSMIGPPVTKFPATGPQPQVKRAH